jgi:uncharacterized protein YjiS (DUF1127 family)
MTTRRLTLVADHDRTAPEARTGGVRSSLLAFLRWLAQVDRAYRERSYLAEMDDRILRDIGITRAEADAEARRRPMSVTGLLR